MLTEVYMSVSQGENIQASISQSNLSYIINFIRLSKEKTYEKNVFLTFASQGKWHPL